tara:strand:- start:43 stop:1335 length:1293 start_codon:yes stop_codon:yes gene_type:complete
MSAVTANSILTSGDIIKCEITSNREGSKKMDISAGIVMFNYYESILDSTVRFTLTVVDTGQGEEGNTAITGLKLNGFEKVELVFEDNLDNKLKFEGDNAMWISEIRNVSSHTERATYTLDLVSKEFLANDLCGTEVYARYDGEISESVGNILSEFLKSKKEYEGDATKNKYNFMGQGKKPIKLMTELARLSVSEEAKESAGYFFYENYDGFRFKAIDILFKEEPIKSFVYNSSTSLPEGYDAKILEYTSKGTINVKKNLLTGTYGSKMETYNPFTDIFDTAAKVVENVAQEVLGGKDLPLMAEEFIQDYGLESRRFFRRLDIGELPDGDVDEQVEKGKDENISSKDVFMQSAMRYNKLFTIVVTIKIPGDLSLRVGEIVKIDLPSQTTDKTERPDKELSGAYMISDICHHLSSDSCLTKMRLVRDSFGRN